MPKSYSITAASRLSGFHFVTVQRAVARGDLIAEKRGGRWRIDAESLDRFMAGERLTSAASPAADLRRNLKTAKKLLEIVLGA